MVHNTVQNLKELPVSFTLWSVLSYVPSRDNHHSPDMFKTLKVIVIKK